MKKHATWTKEAFLLTVNIL